MYGRLSTPEAKTPRGLRFRTEVRVRTTGGTSVVVGDAIEVREARAVTIVIGAGTDFRGRSLDEVGTSVDAAVAAGVDALRDAHVRDHRALFDRVSLMLGPAESAATARALPTDERLRAVQQGATDADLLALYFQYGRYLLMGTSRPGGLPANLQGLCCPRCPRRGAPDRSAVCARAAPWRSRWRGATDD